MSQHTYANGRQLSRRSMLRLTAFSVTGMALAACAPSGSAPADSGSAPAQDDAITITIFDFISKPLPLVVVQSAGSTGQMG